MSATWEQTFDFYVATSDGVPVLNTVDLAAEEHAPVAGCAHLVTVAVRMRHPDENGLRSDEDARELFDLEETLTAELARDLDAIYVGRRVGWGRTDFFFYTPSEPGLAWGDRIRDHALAGWDFAIRSAEDPEWSFYRDLLPGPFHRQTMWNRQTQLQLAEHGDVLTKRRRVDHRADFPGLDAARAAAGLLKRRRFRVARPEGPDAGGRFALDFSRKDSVGEQVPDETTIEILDCIEPSDGRYDGWGCAVTR